MAIVIYECDRCKRTIQLTQNIYGLEVMGKCIITEACHGNLIFQSVKQAYKTGQPPALVEGLQDWVQRKVLFTHNQSLKTTVWKIEHNLGVNPSVKAFTFNQENELVETDPLTIVYNDPNNLTLTFNNQVDGVAQCIARTTAPLNFQGTPVTTTAPVRNLTTNGIFTIAVPELVLDVNMSIQFLAASTLAPLAVANVTFGILPSISSPWSNVSTITIAGLVYKVKTVDMRTVLDSLSIADFAPFYIIDADIDTTPTTTPLALQDIILLLGNSPFTVVDKDLVEIVLASTISSIQTAPLTYAVKGDMYIQPSLIKQTYPPIKFKTLT